MFFGLLFEVGPCFGVGLGWIIGSSTLLLYMGKVSFEIGLQISYECLEVGISIECALGSWFLIFFVFVSIAHCIVISISLIHSLPILTICTCLNCRMFCSKIKPNSQSRFIYFLFFIFLNSQKETCSYNNHDSQSHDHVKFY
jgi:hypothetical protein